MIDPCDVSEVPDTEVTVHEIAPAFMMGVMNCDQLMSGVMSPAPVGSVGRAETDAGAKMPTVATPRQRDRSTRTRFMCVKLTGFATRRNREGCLPGARGYPRRVHQPRDIVFEPDAITALTEILGIMADQIMGETSNTRWEITRLAELEARLMAPAPGDPVTIGIDDAALLLDGMAFTEVMSIEFPWFEMVQWTSDFVTAELRQHWTDDEWRDFSARA